MPEKYTKESLLGILPKNLTELDKRSQEKMLMAEVALDSNNLTPDVRRKKMVVSNTGSAGRIIGKE